MIQSDTVILGFLVLSTLMAGFGGLGALVLFSRGNRFRGRH